MMLTDVILSEVRVGSGPAEGGMGVIHPCTVLGLERTEWLTDGQTGLTEANGG